MNSSHVCDKCDCSPCVFHGCCVFRCMVTRSDSILVIMNLKIVQAKMKNRVKKQECLHANMHTLMKVDSSGSSTVTNLTRGSAKTHDCSSLLCSLNGSHSQSQSLDQRYQS